MKKQVIAAAVAAAFAVPATAQVTVSGTLDTAVGAVTKGGSATNGQYTGFVSNTFATSGITFAGTEDLGGGLRAGFTINKQFTVSNGTATANDPTIGGQATAGVTGHSANFDVISASISGGFGSVSVGRQDIAGREGFGFGRTGNFGRTTGLSTLGDEVVNSVNYTSPTISGVTVVAATGLATGAQATTNKTTGYGISYVGGPLRVGYNYQTSDTSAGAKGKNLGIAADYNLGMARVGFIHLRGDTDTSAAGELQGNTINLNVPLGSGLEVLGSYTTLANTASTNNATNDATILQVAVTKALSKRTTVFASHTVLNNEADATFAARGTNAATSGSQTGLDPKATVIGIRHTF